MDPLEPFGIHFYNLLHAISTYNLPNEPLLKPFESQQPSAVARSLSYEGTKRSMAITRHTTSDQFTMPGSFYGVTILSRGLF
jgi:hypothetical protein